ncbi:MAG: alpha/beta hydrolase [Bacillota bacterium]
MRQTSGTFTGEGGLKLFYRLWEPDEVRGNLVIAHGAMEHTGRYEHVASWFAARHFAVWAIDHRGHGQSEGLRMYVDRFEEYLADLHEMVKLATAKHGAPILLGHSMGGLISYRYAVAYPGTIKGLVLTSPWFQAKTEPTAVQKALLPLILRLLPRLAMESNVPPENCTRNPEFHARDRQDPLRNAKVTPRWWVEMNEAAAACHTSMSLPSELPVLFVQAGDDLLVDPDATRAIFERVGHDRKAFRLLAGKYHEVLNDPGYEEVLTEVHTWLKAQGVAE